MFALTRARRLSLLLHDASALSSLDKDVVQLVEGQNSLLSSVTSSCCHAVGIDMLGKVGGKSAFEEKGEICT